MAYLALRSGDWPKASAADKPGWRLMFCFAVWQRPFEFLDASGGDRGVVEAQPFKVSQTFQVNQPGVGDLGVVETQVFELCEPFQVNQKVSTWAKDLQELWRY